MLGGSPDWVPVQSRIYWLGEPFNDTFMKAFWASAAENAEPIKKLGADADVLNKVRDMMRDEYWSEMRRKDEGK